MFILLLIFTQINVLTYYHPNWLTFKEIEKSPQMRKDSIEERTRGSANKDLEKKTTEMTVEEKENHKNHKNEVNSKVKWGQLRSNNLKVYPPSPLDSAGEGFWRK